MRGQSISPYLPFKARPNAPRARFEGRLRSGNDAGRTARVLPHGFLCKWTMARAGAAARASCATLMGANGLENRDALFDGRALGAQTRHQDDADALAGWFGNEMRFYRHRTPPNIFRRLVRADRGVPLSEIAPTRNDRFRHRCKLRPV